MADSRNYANIYFNDVSVDESSLLGDLETAGETVESFWILGELLCLLKCLEMQNPPLK